MEVKYDLIRQAAVTLGGALIVAAAIIGWSLPEPASAPRFQGFVVNDKIVRLNTRDGNMVACDFDRCVRILGNGKELQPNSAPGLNLKIGGTAPAQPAVEAPAKAEPPGR